MISYQMFIMRKSNELVMDIKNINLDLLTEEELREIEGGGIGFLLVCFAAGMAIGLGIV